MTSYFQDGGHDVIAAAPAGCQLAILLQFLIRSTFILVY